MNSNNKFNQIVLSSVKQNAITILKAKVFKELNKHSWGYKYGNGQVEFHITPNKYLKSEFYWYGSGDSITEAKSSGWIAFLNYQQSQTIEQKAI